MGQGFDHIDTASQVRDIIKRTASQIVQQQAPKPNIARVISVNFASLTASVWYPGDDAPVTVNLFADTLPAIWQDQIVADAASGIENTSFSGYGSLVGVENLNGKLYITSVLSGGQLSFNAALLNANIITQEATEIADDIAGFPNALPGDPYETIINCHVSNSSVGYQGGIDFGPFTNRLSGTALTGAIEMTVYSSAGAIKTYKFTIDPIHDFFNNTFSVPDSPFDSWFRILPDGGIMNQDTTIVDFDLDVTLKRTAYGNTDQFASFSEVWFRIIKQDGTTGLDCFVTIKSTNLQRGRSLGGRQLFMQQRRTSPPFIRGYIGFHNSTTWSDLDISNIMDNFGRVQSTNWGFSETNQPWNVITGAITDFRVDGEKGIIESPANTPFRVGTSAGASDYEYIYWECAPSALPTGAEYQSGCYVRYKSTDNYFFKVVFETTGAVTLSIFKTVASVITQIGANITVPSVTFTPGMAVSVKARCVGSTLQIKAWNAANGTEPEAWLRTVTDTSIPNGTGTTSSIVLFAQPGGANTNTKPYDFYYYSFNGRVQGQNTFNPNSEWHSGPYRSGLLRLANDLQKTWTHDGTFTWDGNNIKWTGNIFLHGVGKNRNGLKTGRINIRYPDGHFIPVWKNEGTIQALSTGLNIPAGYALWWGLPPGTPWLEQTDDYFFFVDSDSMGGDFQIPEWAILIAIRVPSTAVDPHFDIRLGNGQMIDGLKAVAFNAGWANTGAGNPLAGVRLIAHDLVLIQGVVTGNTTTSGAVYGVVPAGYRPSVTQIIPARGGTGGVRATVAVLTNGNCQIFDATGANNYQVGPAIYPLNT